MIGNSFYRACMRRVAIHEAGHFTCYAAFPDEYSIEEVGVDVLSGYVRLSKHYPPTFHMLVGYFAGIAAQKIILGTKRPAKFMSSDIMSARNIAFKIDRSDWRAVMRAGRVAAERFARANQAQIEAVARTLCRLGGGDIDGPRLMARLNQLPPLTAIPPRDWWRHTPPTRKRGRAS